MEAERSDIEREIERVYRADHTRFVRVAAAICGEDGAGADVVQEAFARALDTAASHAGRGSVEAWLWAIVVNRARNHRRGLRRRLARQRLLVSDEAVAVDDPQREAVRAAVAELPMRQRTVVFLRHFGDLDDKRIAGVLGISEGTVGATLTQAHTALRRRMEEGL